MEKTVIVYDPENNVIIYDGQVFRKEISEAHSSIHTGEKMMPELKTSYDHLIGKWVRCVYDSGGGIHSNVNEWVQVTGLGKLGVSIVRENGCVGQYPLQRFDLDNPRDYKPHEIPAEIMEGLIMLPTDHPEFGNIREKAIEAAERLGHHNGVDDGTGWPNKICKAIDWFDWTKDNVRHWRKIYKIASSGAFDPVAKIPFSLDRWQSGDFIRVETRDGREVTGLRDFGTDKWPLIGVITGRDRTDAFTAEGSSEYLIPETRNDLFLIVKA